MASIEGMDRVGCTADTGSGSTDGGEGRAPGVRAVADAVLGMGAGSGSGATGVTGSTGVSGP